MQQKRKHELNKLVECIADELNVKGVSLTAANLEQGKVSWPFNTLTRKIGTPYITVWDSKIDESALAYKVTDKWLRHGA